MSSFQVDGIIVKRINFGEKDKILTVITRDNGKIKMLAKGVRRINSRRAGNVELFNFARLHLAVGRTFNILTEAKLLETFPSLRKDLKKSAAAFYFSELVERFVPEDQENRAIFTTLLSALRKLEGSHSIQMGLIQDFETQLLEKTGFGHDREFEPEKTHLVLEKVLGRSLPSRLFLDRVWQIGNTQ